MQPSLPFKGVIKLYKREGLVNNMKGRCVIVGFRWSISYSTFKAKIYCNILSLMLGEEFSEKPLVNVSSAIFVF